MPRRLTAPLGMAAVASGLTAVASSDRTAATTTAAARSLVARVCTGLTGVAMAIHSMPSAWRSAPPTDSRGKHRTQQPVKTLRLHDASEATFL